MKKMQKNYSVVTRATYQKLTQDYIKPRPRWHVADRERQKFINLIKPRGIILDIGCGGGHHAEYFLKHGFKITGIDFVPALIRVAKKRAPKGTFLVIDMTKMRFPPRSFDAVWMAASLHHLPKKLVPRILKKVFTILRPDGWIYIAVHAGKNEGFEISEKFNKRVVRYMANYQNNEMKVLLFKQGFRKISTYIAKPKQYPVPATQKIHWLIVFAQKPK